MDLQQIFAENNYVKYYITLDNRDFPFAVFIHPRKVRVYNLVSKTEIKSNFEYKKIFIGKSVQNRMTTYSGSFGPTYDGNSILLYQGNHRYVFIGHEIFSFLTGCKIVDYHSPVGNNLVPYPYAVDKNHNSYLMLEKVVLNTDEEPYEKFYHGDSNFFKFKIKQIANWLIFFNN